MNERQIEAMRENIANLQSALSLQLGITKTILEENEVMLKHITDLESALGDLMNLWLNAADYSDFDKAVQQWRDKFAYLEIDEDDDLEIDEDDGYEPPEHMTADDFNEMHSGPYWPDDSGYMDGDE